MAKFTLGADCENDPNECTPKNLCGIATDFQNGLKVWSSKLERSMHVKFAKQLGMDCGATEPQVTCGLNANECKISELCEIATTGSETKQWNEAKPDHVRLAKEYSITCGVGETQPILKATTCSSVALEACDDGLLCQIATSDKKGVKQWASPGSPFKKEAEKRGLSCGVISTKFLKECGVENIGQCTDDALCKKATKKLKGKNVWTSKSSIYVEIAKQRKLSCGVTDDKTASCFTTYIENCTSETVCERATRTQNGKLMWVNNAYVKEAKRRGLSCSVKTPPPHAFNKYKRYNFTGERQGEVTIGVVDPDWNGERFYSWPNGAALFLKDWQDHKSYESNSNTNDVFPYLRTSFNQLPKSTRIQIQSHLRSKGMYSDASDGLWGRNTLIALVDYSSKKFLTIQLDNSEVVEEVISAISRDQSRFALAADSASVRRLHQILQNTQSSKDQIVALKKSFEAQTPLRKKQIQHALKKLGVYSSTVDGLWGKNTSNAFTNYIKINSEEATNAEALFASILSKVDVPSRFAEPSKPRESVVKKPAPQLHAAPTGWTTFSAATSVTWEQADTICEPIAKNARSGANVNFNNNIRCTESFGNYNCSRGPSGAAAGFLQGFAKGMAKKNAYKNTYTSCMAQYGWKKN